MCVGDTDCQQPSNNNNKNKTTMPRLQHATSQNATIQNAGQADQAGSESCTTRKGKSCCLLETGMPTRQLLLHAGVIDTTASVCDVTGLDGVSGVDELFAATGKAPRPLQDGQQMLLHDATLPAAQAPWAGAATTAC
jgi:hypothetical protein